LKITLLVFGRTRKRGEPSIGRGLVTVGDGDEVDVGIGWGDCAQAEERLFSD
jgi:hypothetical protein